MIIDSYFHDYIKEYPEFFKDENKFFSIFRILNFTIINPNSITEWRYGISIFPTIEMLDSTVSFYFTDSTTKELNDDYFDQEVYRFLKNIETNKNYTRVSLTKPSQLHPFLITSTSKINKIDYSVKTDLLTYISMFVNFLDSYWKNEQLYNQNPHILNFQYEFNNNQLKSKIISEQKNYIKSIKTKIEAATYFQEYD